MPPPTLILVVTVPTTAEEGIGLKGLDHIEWWITILIKLAQGWSNKSSIIGKQCLVPSLAELKLCT